MVYLKKINNFIKLFIILIAIFGVGKINVLKDVGTVYNDKEGQAREMLNLAFVIAMDGDKSDIPLIDGKYVRTPYHKLTLENIEEYE